MNLNTEVKWGIVEFDDSYSDEEEITEIPKEIRKINTQAYDKSVADIVRMINEGDINLNAEYQRNYVWDNKRASLLIESIILNVPIPVIYVSQEDDDSWTVIDGLQRLNTLKRFFDRDFKLMGLDILSDLNKSDSKSLNPKALRVLKNGLLRIIMITNDSHEEIKYDVFMRLNRGAVKLNEQELRNCLYRGSLNDTLRDLAKTEVMLELLNLKEPHSRMMDRELILRCLAMLSNWDTDKQQLVNYKGRMKTFLNQFMLENKAASPKHINNLKTLFTENIIKVHEIFGPKALRRRNTDGVYETSLNRAIMDALIISVNPHSQEELIEKKDAITDGFYSLIEDDQDFRDSITIATSDKKVMDFRISKWCVMLENILK
jgi:hypothetical protein